MTDQQEAFGQMIDSLDNLTRALNLPMPDQFHVAQLKRELPKLVADLKDIFVALVGENPWSN